MEFVVGLRNGVWVGLVRFRRQGVWRLVSSEGRWGRFVLLLNLVRGGMRFVSMDVVRIILSKRGSTSRRCGEDDPSEFDFRRFARLFVVVSLFSVVQNKQIVCL